VLGRLLVVEPEGGDEMRSRRRWFFTWVAVAFAAAAFVAPAAQAVVPVNAESAGATVRQPVARHAVPVSGTTDSFSWSDAGVGAAAAFSLVLLAGGGVLIVHVVRGTRRSGLADA
jgi:hypothetical protein